MPKGISREEIEDCLEQYISGISYYKNTLDMEKASHMAKLEQEQLYNIINAYDHEKNRRKVLDFDDMLYLCLKLLQENEPILKLWQERVSYYLIDEFQDCNPVQYKILRMLAGNESMKASSKPKILSEIIGGNIFAVGDDDQAIYGFRGADSMILQRFLADYPYAKRVTLGINYRCSHQIVKASSEIIMENKLRMEKQLQSANIFTEDGRVTIRRWPSKSHMLQYMMATLSALSKEALREHAVLFRTNQEAQMFASEMAKYHISFQLKGQTQSIYEHFVVKDMMAYLEAAWGNRERKLFLRILNKPRTNIGREALEEERVDFQKLKAFYENPYMKNPQAFRDVECLEQRLNQLRKLPLSLGIRYVRKAMNYEKYLTKRADGNEALLTSWFELLDWLQEDAAAYKTPEEWKHYQEEYEQIYRNKEKESKNQGVRIMTMHGSKGLEFEHCYILNVNEGTIPKYQKGEKLLPEQIEEERRIFYVAMTRAKKNLELHCLTGTRERPKLPSRFIEKLIH